MVHLPPQVDKICQKIDAFMVKYPSLTQYGACINWFRNSFSLRSLCGVPIVQYWGYVRQILPVGWCCSVACTGCSQWNLRLPVGFASTCLVSTVDPRQCGMWIHALYNAVLFAWLFWVAAPLNTVPWDSYFGTYDTRYLLEHSEGILVTRAAIVRCLLFTHTTFLLLQREQIAWRISKQSSKSQRQSFLFWSRAFSLSSPGSSAERNLSLILWVSSTLPTCRSRPSTLSKRLTTLSGLHIGWSSRYSPLLSLLHRFWLHLFPSISTSSAVSSFGFTTPSSRGHKWCTTMSSDLSFFLTWNRQSQRRRLARCLGTR